MYNRTLLVLIQNLTVLNLTKSLPSQWIYIIDGVSVVTMTMSVFEYICATQGIGNEYKIQFIYICVS